MNTITTKGRAIERAQTRDRIGRWASPGLAIVLLLGLSGYKLGVFGNPASDQPVWNGVSPYPDRIVLTWAEDPATTQSITWRTDPTVSNAVAEYALASPGPGFGFEARKVTATTQLLDASKVKDANVTANYHSVTLRELRPDTIYAYRVGDGERWSEWFHFRTASRSAEPFSFIYFGDAQNDILSLWSRNIRGSYAEAPDARFMIHAGDLVNNAQNDVQWGEWFRAGGFIHAMVPSVPAVGNHEYDPLTADSTAEEELAVTWRPQFTLPRNGIATQQETNYYFDYQGARIIVLNSNENRPEQAAWLERVLSENTQPWTIATFHQPIFSSARERDNPALRAAWKPIFDKHGVDLVLQGHDHNYARGRTSSTAVKAANVATGANARDPITGTVYVVSVSGRKMYPFKTGEWGTYEAQLDRRAENTQLFQVIRISGDTLRYRAHTAIGTLYDSFELVRGREGNRFIERMPNVQTRVFTDAPTYRW